MTSLSQSGYQFIGVNRVGFCQQIARCLEQDLSDMAKDLFGKQTPPLSAFLSRDCQGFGLAWETPELTVGVTGGPADLNSQCCH